MDIEVLGTLSVRENGVPIAPTAPKPRQVLGLLALHADQVVSVATLIEEPLGEVPGSRIGVEIKRLEEARLCALDQRIEADLLP